MNIKQIRHLLMLSFASLLIVTANAADTPESGSEVAKRRYAEKIEKAEKALLAGLEKLIEQSESGRQITAQKLAPEQLLKLSERLKVEKARFIEKGGVPFASPAIRITGVYLSDLAAARTDLSAALNREITKAQKMKDPEAAKAIAAELATLMEPTVLVTWEYTYGPDQKGIFKFLSDGSVDEGSPKEGRPKWGIQNGKLVMSNSKWTDVLEPDLMGLEIKGKNNFGGAKSGKRADD